MEAAQRRDGRIIIHFDYGSYEEQRCCSFFYADLYGTYCFYAAVFEKENPSWKFLPLAVQQKQIIVTCNYEARRRGLYKLQLVHEAKKACPDVIIVLGEDLTRFRNASKDNYDFFRGYTWSNKVERLGFDEVFMDVTDVIDYNFALLNHNDLPASFFHLDRNDPTVGFPFDASSLFGHTFPASSSTSASKLLSTNYSFSNDSVDLLLRLRLGSHFAWHLRHQLEEQKGYTCTVGISTNKLSSKLVGNLNKPKGQTTLVPPYNPDPRDGRSNVIDFIDGFDIGQIPGIGFKIAQKIRNHVLGRPAVFKAGLIYGGTKENVHVRDVRIFEGMGPEALGRVLAGPGVPRDLGNKIWGLIHGVDDTEVAKAKEVPQQISIEDSYIRLDEVEQVRKELKMLSESLIKRMRLDLTSLVDDEDMGITLEGEEEDLALDTKAASSRRWIAHPKTLRLSTRPRPLLNPDGTRSRNFTRISKSSSMPSFVLSLAQDITVLAEKLVEEALLPLFRKLHPGKSGWNLSLVNLCATNMSMAASEGKAGAGRDIGRMFRRQEDALKGWKIADVDVAPSDDESEDRHIEQDDVDQIERGNSSHYYPDHPGLGSQGALPSDQGSSFGDEAWDSECEENEGARCQACGAMMPSFAMVAHERFHSMSG
ncbi:MAG: hypothetical protein ASARMPREDX12_009515 [Alectoria sarmentosa]|nr:MAG: hypothetical protein ASARMPREDX12_009515 [Alectoria sarmentosa]